MAIIGQPGVAHMYEPYPEIPHCITCEAAWWIEALRSEDAIRRGWTWLMHNL